VFATHYHELTQLAEELPAVRNFTVAVREVGDRVLFLHRLVPGGADRSYGIEVGRLAGLPATVLERARAVLGLLEGEGAAMVPALGRGAGAPGGAPPSALGSRPSARRQGPVEQLGLFAAPHPVVERLRSVDPNRLTPLQALELLAQLVDEAGGTSPMGDPGGESTT
jgi:DNA mismatch repair protein MutS